MIDVRRAGPADADGLMELRGVMLGSIGGGPPATGDWQRIGAAQLRERLRRDHPGHDHSGHDHSGRVHSGPDRPTSDHPGSDHPGSDHPGSDHPGRGAAALAAFVVDRTAGPGLAACVVGQIDQRLPGPGDPTGLRGYVYNVATDPAYRRRGFSRACMAALLDWFDGRGVTVVDLRASPDGEPLYASLGFTRTPDPAMRRRRPPGPA